MKIIQIFYLHLFCFIPLVVPPAFGFSWDVWNFFRPHAKNVQIPSWNRNVKRISHQSASDPNQDLLLDNAAWFKTDGTPLFYSAWRAKPGAISPEPTSRSSLGKYGARVSCWPSTGGVWIKQADLVDLNFLELSRFTDTPRQFDQTAEDKFCTRLMMIGPEWWNLPAPFETRAHLGKEQFMCDTLEDCFEPHIKNKYLIARPELKKVACYVPIQQVMKEADGSFWNRYHNSMVMEERCDMIRSIGGKWCGCKAECPDLKDIDWSFKDPGSDGCLDLVSYIENPEEPEVGFHPEETEEVVEWADDYCVKNGWKKLRGYD